jgi:hypothetical protein
MIFGSAIPLPSGPREAHRPVRLESAIGFRLLRFSRHGQRRSDLNGLRRARSGDHTHRTPFCRGLSTCVGWSAAAAVHWSLQRRRTGRFASVGSLAAR